MKVGDADRPSSIFDIELAVMLKVGEQRFKAKSL